MSIFLRFALLACAALATYPTCALAQARNQAVAAVLDDWHQAASATDETRYFGHFAPTGVFLGTDATERWTVSSFREYAHPYFQAKKGWSFKPRERHIDFSPAGNTAWFDELLDTAIMGLCRGSGVLILLDGQWKILQYNLSIPVPNSLAKSIVKEISGSSK